MNASDLSPTIFSTGTRVVTLNPVQNSVGGIAHPAGAVGIVVKSPVDLNHAYRIRFADSFESAISHDGLVLLATYRNRVSNTGGDALSSGGLYSRVIFRCVIGSRAYGLEDENSDTDRRGVYLPPADAQWSLYGVPEQLENDATEEVYWEFKKFLVLALKANPNVLECLYSPIVEHTTPLGDELLANRQIFLSKLVFQTYSGYVASQFKKIQTEVRNRGQVKWKHVMHLVRLLISGSHVLCEGSVNVDVGQHRDRLTAIKRGEVPWEQADAWRIELQQKFNEAFDRSDLPERPDYEAADRLLIKARRLSLEDRLP